MGKKRNAQRAEAKKKAKQKKIIAVTACVAGVLLVAGFILWTVSNKSDSNDKSSGVDIDLTALSVTVAAARYQNIMLAPDNYVGQTIKARGYYDVIFDDATDSYLHFVGLDCPSGCLKWFEFVREGDYAFPDDYPETYTSIEVTGTFDTYNEQGQKWYYIASDEMTVVG